MSRGCRDISDPATETEKTSFQIFGEEILLGHEISGNERNLLGVNEVSSAFTKYRDCFVALSSVLSQWTANDSSSMSRFLRLHQSHKILNRTS